MNLPPGPIPLFCWSCQLAKPRETFRYVVTADGYRRRVCGECAGKRTAPGKGGSVNKSEAEKSMLTDCGHGWVYPNPDGIKARCGGPGMCRECSSDLAAKRKFRRESVAAQGNASPSGVESTVPVLPTVLNQTRQAVHDLLEPHIREIAKLFKSGVKLTVICRSPKIVDADVIMTCDDLDEVIRVIERYKDDSNYVAQDEVLKPAVHEFDGHHLFGNRGWSPHCVFCGMWRSDDKLPEKCSGTKRVTD